MWLNLSVSTLVFYSYGSTFYLVSTKTKMGPFSLDNANTFTKLRSHSIEIMQIHSFLFTESYGLYCKKCFSLKMSFHLLWNSGKYRLI